MFGLPGKILVGVASFVTNSILIVSFVILISVLLFIDIVDYLLSTTWFPILGIVLMFGFFLFVRFGPSDPLPDEGEDEGEIEILEDTEPAPKRPNTPRQ